MRRINAVLLAVAFVASVCGIVASGTTPVGAACTGAGAWTKPAQYQQNGSYASEQRVKWAIGGIQNTLNARGKLSDTDFFTEVYTYGPKTKAAVLDLENDPGSIVGTPDGKVGPTTSRWLFQPYLLYIESVLGIPRHLLHGVIGIEGDYDPGAQGCSDVNDRGMLQYNSIAHPEVSDAQAYGEPVSMMSKAGNEMKSRFNYIESHWGSGLTTAQSWNAAAAGHNSPVNAYEWAQCMVFGTNGCTPNATQAYNYYSSNGAGGVQSYAAAYPY